MKECVLFSVGGERSLQANGSGFICSRGEEESHLNSQMVMDGYVYHYTQYSGSCPQPQVLAMAVGDS